MATVEQDLADFTNYARQRIEAGQPELSIDELFDQWRAEKPSGNQYAENVAAIQASIHDFKNGERGTPAGEHSCTSFLQTARELHLEGPADWASNLDEYLYGKEADVVE